MDLDDALLQSIARVTGAPVDDIADDTTLDALGVDSLAAAELITDLEIRLGQDLPIDVLRRLGQARTVGDVRDQLRQALSEPPGPLR